MADLRVYATNSELADWLGESSPPDGADRILRAASLTVDRMLLTAVYDTDDDGYPTDQDTADTLRDATCAQAEHQIETGDPYGVGAGQIVQGQIGSVSFTRRAAGSAGDRAPGRRSPQAAEILHHAGLTTHRIYAAGLSPDS